MREAHCDLLPANLGTVGDVKLLSVTTPAVEETDALVTIRDVLFRQRGWFRHLLQHFRLLASMVTTSLDVVLPHLHLLLRRQNQLADITIPFVNGRLVQKLLQLPEGDVARGNLPLQIGHNTQCTFVQTLFACHSASLLWLSLSQPFFSGTYLVTESFGKEQSQKLLTNVAGNCCLGNYI